jgi:TetR/AcrR family transcriptional regulator, regulator of cefoperazone and chloramphenicol sensitivity
MPSIRRHKAESSYPRGEETRAKIIRTAISLFGEKGFAGVSTREIASAAGVPPPSLQYYFENKEGLYRACIEDIHASAWNAIGPAVGATEKLLARTADTDSLIDAYCAILDSLADFLLAMPDGDSRALFVAQHRLPSRAASEMPKSKSEVGRRIRNCCVAVIARIAGDLTDEECRIVSTTIVGQLIIVHHAREQVETMLGWDEITAARVEMLKATVRRQTIAILNSYRSA